MGSLGGMGEIVHSKPPLCSGGKRRRLGGRVNSVHTPPRETCKVFKKHRAPSPECQAKPHCFAGWWSVAKGNSALGDRDGWCFIVFVSLS